jgi:AcrR family transcriptional regulator
MTATRLTRNERKTQTHEALLDAGYLMFLRDGFHAASLERVAAEAGFTKGAVYSHFATKADLFLAIFERRVQQRVAAQDGAGARVDSYRELVGVAVEQWGAVLREERGWSLLLLEFWTYAARHPHLREHVAAQHRRTHDSIAALLASMRARSGLTLAADDQSLATVVMAVGNGLNLDTLVFSDSANVELYQLTLETLLEGLEVQR